MLFKAVHPEKTLPPILLSSVGKLMVFNEVHSEKALY